MEKLQSHDRVYKGKLCLSPKEGLVISNSQVRRLERNLKDLKEEVG